MKILALLIFAIGVTASPCRASTALDGNIYYIQPLSQNVFFFAQTGTRSTRPGCATVDRWVIDVSTAGGQALVASLLTAYSLRKKIVIVGTGTCSIWGDTETVNNFYIVD